MRDKGIVYDVGTLFAGNRSTREQFDLAVMRREIDIILRIKQLLYSEGFTIAGAKKKLETEMSEPAAPVAPASAPAAAKIDLGDVKKELRAILALLE